MNGILVLLKPPGMTSHDVVAVVRRDLGQRRVGHTGTLDPGAAGVLVLCLGSATRLIPYMEEHLKGYRGELWLGRATDTQDVSGEVLQEEQGFSLTDGDLQRGFAAFQGDIQQIPPMVSALKHQGKRLYQLARQGRVVERKPRSVKIYELSPVGTWQKGQWQFGDVVQFDVICSKGTYIRTLCQDIGEYLGVPAHMSFLLRTRVGPWSLQDAITLEEFKKIAEDGCREKLASSEVFNVRGFFSMDRGVEHLPGVVVSLEAARNLRNGVRVKAGQVAHLLEPKSAAMETMAGTPGSQDFLRVYDIDGGFMGIGRGETVKGEWELQPVRVLPLESDKTRNKDQG